MKINSIRLTHLRNEAHYQFYFRLKELFTKYTNVADLVSQMYPQLMSLFDKEGSMVDSAKTSQFTEQIAEADNRRDRAIVGFSTAIDAFLYHYDPDKVAAAHTVENRLKDFRGLIEKKSYEEESAAIKALTADLQANYTAQLTLLKLDGWITELVAAQAEFDNLFDQRNAEWSAKPAEKMSNIRKEIDIVYRSIAAFINAHALIGGEPDCSEFIKQLNMTIEYFKEHDHHHTKIDIVNAEPAPIQQQQYTGRPVTPPVDVLYVTNKGETVRLVLGKDYDVTYKHNIEVGNAECTIRGKGAYRGNKTVTFIIAR
ncbi:MAG: DUF6261 family protein [Dysgonamonadaceae bacterium]|jgi:hypothetical protein|nr:DUF6261 family protein [Dysgonamonadaceae bacterium]